MVLDRLKELQERFQDKETVDGREDKESVSQSEQDGKKFPFVWTETKIPAKSL